VAPRVMQLAARDRLLAMHEPATQPTVAQGALMGFGVSTLASYRHSAEFVDKILSGASPAELPVQEQREFDFVVNVRSAEALGLTFPPEAAAQVTQWILQ
jgi:putative ABC transport system substrate-binding protein